MRAGLVAILVLILSTLPSRVDAAEGSTIAGVVGGNDIRTALPVPPGLYVAGAVAFSHISDFFDGSGRSVAALNNLEFDEYIGAVGALYVPETPVFGGTIGVLASLSGGRECGRIFSFSPRQCVSGLGDPYIELNWSKFFGTYRSSQYVGAYPIAEGLAVQAGVGVVIPTGRYGVIDATTSGLAIGDNVWDIAPSVAVTYTSPAILADGTEFSAKLYWNNFLENEETSYRSGDLLTLDFALTERIGQFQVGLAGVYVEQIEDDRQFGLRVAPDGRRVQGLSLGAIVNYDIPKYGGSLKFKAMAAVNHKNSVNGSGGAVVYAMKLY